MREAAEGSREHALSDVIRSVGRRVVRERAVEALVDGLGAVGANEERVSIMVGACGLSGGQVATGAKFVFHDHGLPSFALSCSARSRADRSALPPAGKGTTMRIVLPGQLCATAGRKRTAAGGTRKLRISRRRSIGATAVCLSAALSDRWTSAGRSDCP
jgi:hypothetical protein